VLVDALLDSGADVALISAGLIRKLENEADFLKMKKLVQPEKVGTAGKDVLSTHKGVFGVSSFPDISRSAVMEKCLVHGG
jgi:hypothetical protein